MTGDRTQRQIDRLLDEAEHAITDEDWSVVAARARAVLRLDDANVDARGYLEAAEDPPNPFDSRLHRQRAMIVLGMHRSGTSMLAGTLEEAGLTLGDVVNQAPDNAKGHRENLAIMSMQEDLLQRNAGSWDNPPETVSWGRLHRAVRDLFISSFRSSKVWGFKDPRTLITLAE